MQALEKDASSIEIGIIIGIAPLTWTVLSPIVGYLVSSYTDSTMANVAPPLSVTMYFTQLPKLGLKFSLSIGLATVGVAYVAMGYVGISTLLVHMHVI